MVDRAPFVRRIWAYRQGYARLSPIPKHNVQDEHMFGTLPDMGDAGSAHARFRRALLTGNLTIIGAAARELPQIGLEDALRILVVMAEKRDDRYGRAAARWAGRVATEKGLGLDESRRVLALVDVLPEAPEPVAERLRSYCS